jgi:hypothetical protein
LPVRFVVITRQMSVVSPEHLPAIMERFAKWCEEYEDRTESFEFFAGGDGGFMVDVSDEVELNRMMAEYPLNPYLEMDVRPIMDADAGLAQWWQVMRGMLSDQP